MHYPPIDYNDMIYYSAPRPKKRSEQLGRRGPGAAATFEKLGIPLEEQQAAGRRGGRCRVRQRFGGHDLQGKARGEWASSSARSPRRCINIPNWCEKYLGSVVPYTDNFFAALNSAVFTDGSFCYIPKGVRCPMELSTYFRINAQNTGQFERTLIVAEEGATSAISKAAPRRCGMRTNCTRRWWNWSRWTTPRSSTRRCRTGIRATRKARAAFTISSPSAACARGRIPRSPGRRWRPARPSPGNIRACILQGDNSVGEFYSVALTNNYQQADTGTKMIHIGKNTRSTIVSKGISAGRGQNSYRGLVKIMKGRRRTPATFRSAIRCCLGDKCGAHTFPYIEVKNTLGQVEHEASTSKIGEDQIFYCKQRGLSTQDAVNMIVNGFCKGSVPRTADGVRGRSAETAGRESGRQRRVMSNPAKKDQSKLLEISNLMRR